MFSKRDVIVFFAGAEAFHTLTHVIIGFSGMLPLYFFGIAWTQELNILAIGINAVITCVLLWLARRRV